MADKELTGFRLNADLVAAMRRFKEQRGVALAAQVEFAMREWLARQGFAVKKRRGRTSPSRSTSRSR